ncbi:MAG: ABC-2 family transporter protein [Ardenticatenaceae bacterium]|nr:ABC-2 family transporter protein [Ardenticatenaceae bacterium]
MQRLKTELSFLKALIGVNLSSAMEYRASFISQILGMMINNGIYFVFWLIFFDQFGAVRGYAMEEIYLLFAVATLGYGIGYMFAGNVGQYLAYLIAQGRLDYYLVLPRPLLPHVIFSRAWWFLPLAMSPLACWRICSPGASIRWRFCYFWFALCWPGPFLWAFRSSAARWLFSWAMPNTSASR